MTLPRPERQALALALEALGRGSKIRSAIAKRAVRKALEDNSVDVLIEASEKLCTRIRSSEYLAVPLMDELLAVQDALRRLGHE